MEDYLKILSPIASALDMLQKSASNLADAVKIWSELSVKLNAVLPTEKQAYLAKRRNMALNKAHFLCFLLDPRYVDFKRTTQAEEQIALDFANEINENILPMIANFWVKAEPFHDGYYRVASDLGLVETFRHWYWSYSFSPFLQRKYRTSRKVILDIWMEA